MTRAHHTPHTDTGAALVLALVATILLAALGVGLIVLSTTESRMAGHYAAGTETMYAADAGVERVLKDLRTQPDWTGLLSGAVQSAFVDGTRRPVAPSNETIDLVGITAELQAESATRPWGANNATWRLYAWGPLDRLGAAAGGSRTYLAVWVADDPSEADGDPLVDTNSVLILHAEAYGLGGARRVIEVTVARDPAPGPGASQADLLLACASVGCYDNNGRYWPPALVPMGTIAAAGSLHLLVWREVR